MNDPIKASQILIVDDTPKNIQILGQLLSEQGYKIIIAENGFEALKVIERVLPDLVLLDIMMPEMDGYETCKRLKESERTLEIPVIFLTAKTETEDILKGFQMGAVDYVTKPFNSSELLQRVKTHLSLKQAREEIKAQNRELIEIARLKDDMDRITKHDLKNPLNTVINFPDLIQITGTLNEKQILFLSHIKEAGLIMLRMINNSLNLVKMERKTYKFEPTQVDIIGILEKIKKDLYPQIAPSKKTRINIFLNNLPIGDKATFYVLGEELLCYSMLTNLIKNAIEASPMEEDIRISIETENTEAIIKVHNYGMVPVEIRNKFFEKYVTFGKGKSGNGLGTYSAKLMVETQKGSISMTTSEENGTIILIRIPRLLP